MQNNWYRIYVAARVFCQLMFRFPQPVLRRRDTHYLREDTRKISRLFETELEGDLVEFQIRQFYILASFLYFQTNEIMDRRNARFFLE